MNPTKPVEIWAGLESTVNRVRDVWYDQCDRNGHCNRIEDLDLFANLKIKKLRYPVLWEKAQINDYEYDFSWVEPRLKKIRELGMEPIATLLHHGSGPKTTSLIDPEFPEKLAHYAKAVAEKFPFLQYYTPVNEPLTTARFSGLYGIWYPHGASNEVMLRILLNECRGSIRAMQEIRKINPQALFIVTEDMGRAQGTAGCQFMVDFQNKRRWISLDLLAGKINENHDLYSWFLENNVTAEELRWFEEQNSPPDIIGINHYQLSNRYIDDRYDMYPPHFRFEENSFKFADLGTTQVSEVFPGQTWAPFIPPVEILREVVTRYDIPVAVTEVQIAGPREAQMQWLNEIWQSAHQLQSEGHRLVAVTPWSLLGSFDWNTLCSQGGDFYEPGVFDVRGSVPRPTALAQMIQDIAEHGKTNHPVLELRGPWHGQQEISAQSRPILISGAHGTLGRAFTKVAVMRGLHVKTVGRSEMDITSEKTVRNVLEQIKPWAVINTAGYVRVDEAENDPEKAFLENVIGSENLARECQRLNIPYMTFSTDLVFDGVRAHQTSEQRLPYLESDKPAPLNVYGRTKAQMEERVLNANSKAVVVRTSSFFSPWDPHNFAVKVLNDLKQNKMVSAATDVVMAPTYVPDLVFTCLDFLIDGVTGVTHLAHRGEMSWAEFARSVADAFKLDHQLIRPHHSTELGWIAARPNYSVLSSERFQVLPTFENALERFTRDIQGSTLV